MTRQYRPRLGSPIWRSLVLTCISLAVTRALMSKSEISHKIILAMIIIYSCQPPPDSTGPDQAAPLGEAWSRPVFHWI